MLEKGRIVDIKDGKAKVELIRNDMCGKCHACEIGSNNRMLIEVDINDDEKIGDSVSLEMKEASMLKATFIMYGIPLLFFFIGVFLGYAISELLNLKNISQIIEAISGILLTSISFMGIKYYSNRIINTEYKPVVKKYNHGR
ncbi:SoxR reducing system RseC family protein [Thermoanaerobacterium sp. RBIITD]|uniref:SoxR reducing system RseC family protein n=1 Tax=Thermoanaerobacterium sp. RBIITD TaxID=1550240 RepID=UPI000BB875F4|nr:SoxR reducing system RseC family protein [Thermoanaerobacterium sp. RBIITD]SNX55302.1 positive regulator of sigma(E), RseC/MucC [Thermoanaerobacterium sp. RBIITD]